MTEQTSRVRQTLRSTRCRKTLNISAIVFGFVSIGGCFILATLTYVLFGDCDDCASNSDREAMVKYFRILATALFLIGILFIALSLCCRASDNSLSPQVVISSVPEGDLEKTPAPVLPYNHIPHRHPLDLPDSHECFVTVENLDEVGPSVNVNAGYWTEEIDGPTTPPPTYQQALEMLRINQGESQSTETENLDQMRCRDQNYAP